MAFWIASRSRLRSRLHERPFLGLPDAYFSRQPLLQFFDSCEAGLDLRQLQHGPLPGREGCSVDGRRVGGVGRQLHRPASMNEPVAPGPPQSGQWSKMVMQSLRSRGCQGAGTLAQFAGPVHSPPYFFAFFRVSPIAANSSSVSVPSLLRMASFVTGAVVPRLAMNPSLRAVRAAVVVSACPDEPHRRPGLRHLEDAVVLRRVGGFVRLSFAARRVQLGDCRFAVRLHRGLLGRGRVLFAHGRSPFS